MVQFQEQDLRVSCGSLILGQFVRSWGAVEGLAAIGRACGAAQAGCPTSAPQGLRVAKQHPASHGNSLHIKGVSQRHYWRPGEGRGSTRAEQSCLRGVSSVLPYALGLHLSTNQLYLSNKCILGKAQKCIFLEIISICTLQRIYWFSHTPEIRVETLYSREADTCAAYQSYTYSTKDTRVESNQLYFHQHPTCSVIL